MKQPKNTFKRLFSVAGRIMPVKQSQEKLMEGLQFPVRSKNSTWQREGNPKAQGYSL